MMDDNLDIGKILDSLLDYTTENEIELKDFLNIISSKITRRQTIILRLILGGENQVKIAKMLGFSASTINLDLRKIKEVTAKILIEAGKDYTRFLNIKRIKEIENKGVLN